MGQTVPLPEFDKRLGMKDDSSYGQGSTLSTLYFARTFRKLIGPCISELFEMEQATPSDAPQSSGTLSQLLGFGGSLIDKNDPEFKPLVTVMVFSGVIFAGMLFYGGSHLQMFETSDNSGGAIGTDKYVFYGILIFFLCIIGAACLTTIARSFFSSSGSHQPGLKLEDNERELFVYCKLAEQGLGGKGIKHYISEPFELDPNDVVKTFERLSRVK